MDEYVITTGNEHDIAMLVRALAVPLMGRSRDVAADIGSTAAYVAMIRNLTRIPSIITTVRLCKRGGLDYEVLEHNSLRIGDAKFTWPPRVRQGQGTSSQKQDQLSQMIELLTEIRDLLTKERM